MIFARFSRRQAVIDALFMTALLGIGIALILGIGIATTAGGRQIPFVRDNGRLR